MILLQNYKKMSVVNLLIVCSRLFCSESKNHSITSLSRWTFKILLAFEKGYNEKYEFWRIKTLSINQINQNTTYSKLCFCILLSFTADTFEFHYIFLRLHLKSLIPYVFKRFCTVSKKVYFILKLVNTLW